MLLNSNKIVQYVDLLVFIMFIGFLNVYYKIPAWTKKGGARVALSEWLTDM